MWASVVSLPRDGCPAFPFNTQDPETGNEVTLSSVLDVYGLFNSWKWNPERDAVDPGKWPERRFQYSLITGIGSFIVDNELQAVMSRKFYCDQYKTVPPFAGAYDDQPEWWVKAVNIIGVAESEATRFARK